LTEVQAKAILDMKLSRLAHLEVEKIEKEKKELEVEKNRIEEILNNEQLLRAEIETGLRRVAELFGDARRTKVINLSETDGDEPIERRSLLLNFTSEGGTYVSETSSLYTQKRNGVGNKFKLEKGEYIVDSIVGDNTDSILFFTSQGNFYHRRMGEFNIGEKQYLNSIVNLNPNEQIKAATILSKDSNKKHILFLTKNGIIKKSLLDEYNLKRNVGATALSLDKGDEIVSVLFTNEDRIGILSEKGNFIIIETKDIRAIGRTARGVVAIKLNEGDHVVSAGIITSDTKEILSISTEGYSKRSLISEFKVTGRGTKGVKIQNSTSLCDFLPIMNSDDILVVSTTAQIRVKLNDINLLGRGAQGTKTIKLAENSKVIKLSKI
jgi:DNA gyrase subunit A